MNNFLLTGIPGIGKTTIIEKVLSLSLLKAGGFYTKEIKDGERRKGFKIVDITTKKESILAHVNIKSPFRVGKYGVDTNSFEEIGVKALEDALENKELIIIDEIGKMELFSKPFQKMVLKCLSSSKKILGSIKIKGNPFVNSIKRREDTKIVEVNEKNRNLLPDEIINLLKENKA
ncbi:MAG TPA: NTPase [Nitrospinota bacterium]|nr:NTPase [Nitrospinota bacterium]